MVLAPIPIPLTIGLTISVFFMPSNEYLAASPQILELQPINSAAEFYLSIVSFDTPLDAGTQPGYVFGFFSCAKSTHTTSAYKDGVGRGDTVKEEVA